MYTYKTVVINEVEYTKEEYPIIIFNDNFLPLGAIFIDFCASSNFFEEIDDDLSKWFWKFTNCVGLNCSEKSDVIIDYSNRLHNLLINNQSYVQKLIDERYSSPEALKIFRWWTDTLLIMNSTAKKKNISKWKGIPVLLNQQ